MATMNFNSLPEVGAFFGVSLSSVNRWRAEGMPWKPGGYSIAKIICWLHTVGPRRSEQARDDYLAAIYGDDYEMVPTFDTSAPDPPEAEA